MPQHIRHIRAHAAVRAVGGGRLAVKPHYLLAGGVAKAQIFQHYIAPELRQAAGVGVVNQIRLHIQQLKDARARRHRALQLRVLHRQVAYRVEEPLYVHYERHQHADLQLVAGDHPRAEIYRQHYRHRGEYVHRRQQARRELARPQVRSEMLGVLFVKQLQIALLAIERLHNAHAGYVFVERAVDDGYGGSDAQKRPHRKRLPYAHSQAQYGQHYQRYQPQLEVHYQQRHDYAAQAEQVGGGHYDHAHKLLQLPHIALYAGHYAPHFGLVVVRQRQPLQMREHRAAQVVQHAKPHARHKHLLQIVRGKPRQRRPQEQPEHRQQPAHIAVFNIAVYAEFYQVGYRHLRAGIDQHCDEREQRQAAIRAHIRQDARNHALVVYPAESLPVRLRPPAAAPAESAAHHHRATPSPTAPRSTAPRSTAPCPTANSVSDTSISRITSSWGRSCSS